MHVGNVNDCELLDLHKGGRWHEHVVIMHLIVFKYCDRNNPKYIPKIKVEAPSSG